MATERVVRTRAAGDRGGGVPRRARATAGIAACALLLAAWTNGSGEEPPVALRRVKLLLLWVPQSQFAGAYVARDEGLYRERGLEVEILRGGPSIDPVEYLKEGKADFAILWLTSALTALDRGVPLVHLGQILDRSHLEVVGWKASGVLGAGDLDGRRVSVWGEPFRPAFSAFFRSTGVEPRIVPQYSTVNLFLLKGVDACVVTDYNEYHLLYQAGVDEDELSRFPLKDAGIDFPEDGIYCLRKTLETIPEACEAIADGTAAGWRRAAEKQEEALDIVMKEVDAANLPTNRAHMEWMLETVLESIFPEGRAEGRLGALPRASYEETVRWLKLLGQIERAPSFEEFVR